MQLLSLVWLFATPWTVTFQAPLSMEFSRQKYWSRLPFPSPSPRDLPDSGIKVLLMTRQLLFSLVGLFSFVSAFFFFFHFSKLTLWLKIFHRQKAGRKHGGQRLQGLALFQRCIAAYFQMGERESK